MPSIAFLPLRKSPFHPLTTITPLCISVAVVAKKRAANELCLSIIASQQLNPEEFLQEMSVILLSKATVLTINQSNTVYPGGWILIEGGKIAGVGAAGSEPQTGGTD